MNTQLKVLKVGLLSLGCAAAITVGQAATSQPRHVGPAGAVYSYPPTQQNRHAEDAPPQAEEPTPAAAPGLDVRPVRSYRGAVERRLKVFTCEPAEPMAGRAGGKPNDFYGRVQRCGWL